MRASTTSYLAALLATSSPLLSSATPLLSVRQQTPALCTDPTLKPFDTSVYAKGSYVCTTAANTTVTPNIPPTTVNVTFAEKTLNTPLLPSEILAALTSITSNATLSINENTTFNVNNTKVVVQPFQCNGIQGWNNKTPTVPQLRAGLEGLTNLVRTALKGKSLASAMAVISSEGDNLAGVQFLMKQIEFIPYNVQCS